MTYLKHHFRRFILLAAAIFMLAATTAGCGGSHDYSGVVKQRADAIARKAVQANGDQPQIVATEVDHYKHYRDYRAIVTVNVFLFDGESLGTGAMYVYGHVTQSGELKLHVDWKDWNRTSPA